MYPEIPERLYSVSIYLDVSIGLLGKVLTMMQFTLPVAISFTLNYTIGSGFLTLPWAFWLAW